jgi:tetratricopeptide (TPR) repeat protein
LNVAFSPDGRFVLTGSSDFTARLWDVATNKPLAPPLQHRGPISGIAFSPNGRLVLTGSDDSTARLWEVATGKPVGAPLQHRGPVFSVAFSPDGELALTGCQDKTAQLWQAITAKPVGAPLQHRAPVSRVAFSPDGRLALTGSQDNTARLWEMPRVVAGNPEQVRRWVNARTGLELDDTGAVRPLDPAAWQENRRETAARFVKPAAADDVSWHLGQAGNSVAAGQWFAARWHLDRLIAANPADRDYRRRRALVAVHQRRWAEASQDFEKSLEPGKEDVQVRSWYALTLAGAGDPANSRRVCAFLLENFSQGGEPTTAKEVAWCCARFPSGPGNQGEIIRLAERVVAESGEDPDSFSILAAALYRAGRFGEVIGTLEKSSKFRRKLPPPWDWMFLAMAHHKLGHAEKARKWLANACKLADQALKDDPKEHAPGISFDWDSRLELQLIRREAEELIRPAQPAGPHP